jgi:quinone-modifying oxidoreductase subunit QmoC
VLAAVRAAAVIEYATPKALAKMVSDPKKLPILLAIPAIIFLVVGLLLKMVGMDWLNFATPPAITCGRPIISATTWWTSS